MKRRHLLLGSVLAPLGLPSAGVASGASAQGADEPAAVVPRPLVFPRDHGAHPDYRIEWWYLTGWLDSQPAPLGFQITFFRARTSITRANPSPFAAQQLIIAHAAIADPVRGALLKEERIARTGFGIAAASEQDTDVLVDRWRFTRTAAGPYRCAIHARDFTLNFAAEPTQPLLLQGEAGFSRKGPQPAQASYYYSQPQLDIRAELTRNSRTQTLHGSAWLDHEWSSTLLDPQAAGWDWIGMNLADGSALTAFQIRRKQDGAALYGYASLRERGASRVRVFGPDEVRFQPLEHWTSPRSNARWPVAQRITVGNRQFATRPLFADQELDLRLSSGTIYWEGASTLTENGQDVGRGYLEMTGYAEPLKI